MSYEHIDESKLNKLDRLGLAWCRLNCWEWDEIVGLKPDGFDNLPKFDPYEIERIKYPLTMQLLSKTCPKRYAKHPSKRDFIRPAKKMIESVIGFAYANRCWFIFELGRTEDEWMEMFSSLEYWSSKK